MMGVRIIVNFIVCLYSWMWRRRGRFSRSFLRLLLDGICESSENHLFKLNSVFCYLFVLLLFGSLHAERAIAGIFAVSR